MNRYTVIIYGKTRRFYVSAKTKAEAKEKGKVKYLSKSQIDEVDVDEC